MNIENGFKAGSVSETLQEPKKLRCYKHGKISTLDLENNKNECLKSNPYTLFTIIDNDIYGYYQFDNRQAYITINMPSKDIELSIEKHIEINRHAKYMCCEIGYVGNGFLLNENTVILYFEFQ